MERRSLLCRRVDATFAKNGHQRGIGMEGDFKVTDTDAGVGQIAFDVKPALAIHSQVRSGLRCVQNLTHQAHKGEPWVSG